MQAQPLIAVTDVATSSRWYQEILGCQSGHGGSEYERLVYQGKLILQLHRWDSHDHPHLGSQNTKPYGNGTVLWFQTDEFDAAIARIRNLEANVLEDITLNQNAGHREIWLQDPDGYVVVIAVRYGDVGNM